MTMMNKNMNMNIRVVVLLVTAVVTLRVCDAQCETSRRNVKLNDCPLPEAVIDSTGTGLPDVHIEFTNYLWVFPQVDQETGM